MSAESLPAAAPSGTRFRALETALELFSRDGYDAVSMRAIAEELGVTKAALYHHFTSKEEVARELVGSYLAAIEGIVTWADATHPELEELLARWVELVRAQGLQIGKFINANQRLIRELGLTAGDGPRRGIDRVADTVVAPDAAPELRMQVRMALIALHTAAIAAEGLPMEADEVFRIARDVAATIVRNAQA
ncbi:TetR/AcrR family transcriptional regulator [Sporichthya sp.]|uniref:TetR/AcrR family transcriptional regulator n=1 Tax=Sporichthya sp. TaxID=65475 RepID=UPI0025D84BBB|nr:TetR/AcrR family transcriptional regulator [Sporichthya sp.]